MRKLSHVFASIVFALLLCLGAAPMALGCAFHAALEVELDSMYPGSFPVAVALRAAADSGVIDAAALEAPGAGTAAYADSVRRLQEFRNALAASPAAAQLPSSFSLGFVESRLWSRYSQSGSEIRVDIHTDGPVEGEAVVLTGEPVLTELLAGRLSVEYALTQGMILIDANDDKKTAIHHALKATSMANRISRR